MDVEIGKLRCEVALSVCRRILERHRSLPMTDNDRREWIGAELTLDLEFRNLVKAREASGKKWKSWEDRGPQRRQFTSYNRQEGKTVVSLYGDIGAHRDGITAADFAAELNAVGNDADIELRIHSNGGGLHDGLAMRAALLRRTGHTHVVVDGLAASAGSIVAMGGDRISMTDGSWLMIHRVRTEVDGDEDSLRDAADKLRQHDNELVQIYMERWTGTADELREALRVETWLSANDAIAWGLADDILARPAVAACVEASNYGYWSHKIPSVLCATNSVNIIHVNAELAELKLKEMEIEDMCSSN